MLSMDVVGTYERDAVNISAMYPGQALNANGTPTTFPADAALKATLSNQATVSVAGEIQLRFVGDPKQPPRSQSTCCAAFTGILSRSRCMPASSGFSSSSPSDPQTT